MNEKKFDYRIVTDPEIFRENQLPAHSDHMFYRKEDPKDLEKSDFRYDLNGLWKFSYADNYASAIPDFEADGFDCHAWKDIRVPGHIQLQGYGVYGYANMQYPWDGHEEIRPGQIPERYNPVASYVKYFTLPQELENKPVYICFEGAESGLALWLNGHYVGYAEDTFTPSEFDLTPYLRSGENKLAAQVFHWTAGSWLEDQDFFRFSGFFRDVYLYTIPEVHVRDLKVRTELNETFTEGLLKLGFELTAPGQVRICLLDQGNCVAETEQKLETRQEVPLAVADPKLWSAEKPHLYDLRIEVCSPKGEWQECVCEKVGFRKFEIRDAIMHLNGQRIVFNGVNRHDFNVQSGRCVSKEDILKDLLTMKQNNINAVRTCHYPNQTYLYQMCDRLGLYVIDETNIETHGLWDAIESGQEELSFAVPGDRKEYLELICDRGNSMIQRDKNHASILIWSLGNEAYGGSDFLKMTELFHKLDDSRPVHYESVARDPRYPETTDITSTMYTTAADIRSWLSEHRDKPYILCEYSHAMGNSCGALHKYTEYAWEEPLYQGGFIWDYIDQSMTLKDRYGRSYQGYGGDFGERPCDYNFSGNGIVYGEHRDPSPKMQEVKTCYQNAAIEFLPEEDHELKIRITNRHLFTDLKEYDAEVTVACEGQTVETALLTLSCAPLQTETVILPVQVPENAGEYTVTISLKLAEDTAWAAKGHEIAWGQTVIRREVKQSTAVQKAADQSAAGCRKPEIVYGWHNIGVRGEGFEVLFSKIHGGLASYVYGGREMFNDLPKPNFWRAPTDNDVANLLAFRSGQWKAAGQYATVKTEAGRGMTICTAEETDQSVKVTYIYHLPVIPATDCIVCYEVFGDGRVEVTSTLPASAEVGQLPEFSMMMSMDADYHHLTWYGFGPEETYLDRCHAKLGVYSNDVKDNMAKYLRPQECGNHMGVRRAAITDDQGRGLSFEVNELQFSALPYAPQMLENARHPQELPEVLNTYIRIGMQQGVGGDDTWGAPVHPEYLLDNSRPLSIRFSFKGI
ncbi:MAG: glycoside hydrolase family 2 TIM barrel-domain containing protein [Eubacteriales bacterium]|nr:glycoside hydrolase family 2 TIM barrel-domain containing protein [Eubacteriales bacterium]